jgi:hypothetical protein
MKSFWLPAEFVASGSSRHIAVLPCGATCSRPLGIGSSEFKKFIRYAADKMKLVPVSTLVNSPRNEKPECVVPVA